MSAPTDSRPVVVICTRNRPDDVRSALGAVAEHRPDAEVLVFDASDSGASAEVCEQVRQERPALRLTHARAPRVGLALQRNDAADLVVAAGHDIVHFIDDDTRTYAGYFDAIEARFRSDPAIVGVGGVSDHRIGVRLRTMKRVFLLDGGRPGTVLRSGRPVHGQVLDSAADGPVQWLAGATMSYRASVFARHRFDERMRGRSLAEDLVFSHAVGTDGTLWVDPGARCLHEQKGSDQGDARLLGSERFLTIHRWVSESSGRLSPAAFWWSVLGEMLLYGGSGLLRRHEVAGRGRALGVVDGVRQLRRRPAAGTP